MRVAIEHSFWLSAEPLVLASSSRARLNLLKAAGIPVEICASGVDERAVEASVAPDTEPMELAAVLARAKAVHVSSLRVGRIVVGADQVMALAGRVLHKPEDAQALRERLLMLSGRSHCLYSAVAVARNGVVEFEVVGEATVQFRNLSEPFIQLYVQTSQQEVASSVGGYQIERLGMHLIERVIGDHTTVLGMPIALLFSQFRARGLIAG